MDPMDMQIVFLPIEDAGKTEYAGCLASCKEIRRIVFVEGQDVPVSVDSDGLDGVCSHLLLTAGDRPAGTLRMRAAGRGTKLERIAVLPEFRGRGFGTLLVEASIASSEGPWYLHAQVPRQGFYERLGFCVSDPHIFYEANIPHRTMVRTQKTQRKIACNITRLS